METRFICRLLHHLQLNLVVYCFSAAYTIMRIELDQSSALTFTVLSCTVIHTQMSAGPHAWVWYKLGFILCFSYAKQFCVFTRWPQKVVHFQHAIPFEPFKIIRVRELDVVVGLGRVSTSAVYSRRTRIAA